MKNYAAFLRGVSPMNCKMSELAESFEAVGFSNVKTVLSSGNVVFSATGTEASVQKKAEAAIKSMNKTFMVFLRPIEELESLLAADPYAKFKLKPASKRVVTFLPTTPTKAPKLPIELDDAKILKLKGRELFSAYVVGPKGPVCMALIERTFGKAVTTRTWDTLLKVCAASKSVNTATSSKR